MKDSIRALQGLGQSLWLDNITRGLLDRGGLVRYRDEFAVTGLTSNPTIFQKAIESGDDYLAAIRAAPRGDAEQLFFHLAIDDLRRAANVFAPVHERTTGVDGWVSLEVSPLLVDDAAASVTQAQALHRRAQRPNLFIKIPGSQAGDTAIEELIFQGVPVNVTLLFSPRQYRACAEAYLRGLERRADAGLPLAIPSVASLFVSRWDVKVAKRVPAEQRNQLGLAVCASVYREYCELLQSPRMQRLMNLGARPQRLLWASTGTKDPEASDTLYVENLAAPLTINTLPEKTLHAWADHGRPPVDAVSKGLQIDTRGAATALAHLSATVGDIDELANELQREGADAFTKSWRSLLAALDAQMKAAA